jgi:hypothetical protein
MMHAYVESVAMALHNLPNMSLPASCSNHILLQDWQNIQDPAGPPEKHFMIESEKISVPGLLGND